MSPDPDFRVEPLDKWPARSPGKPKNSGKYAVALMALRPSQKLVVALNGKTQTRVGWPWYAAGKRTGRRIETRRVGDEFWIRLKPTTEKTEAQS